MPRVNIYIRNEDYSKWQSIEDKPSFINEAINNLEFLKSRRDKQFSQAKKWREDNPDRLKELNVKKMRRYRLSEQFKAKERVRSALRRAVIKGKVIKPTTCESCQKETKIEGHHTDYSKPLEVVWLCRKCHRAVHYPKVVN